VWRGGESVGKTEAAVNAEVIVSGRLGEEGGVRGLIMKGFCWAKIEKVCSCVESVSPVVGWHRGLKKNGAENVIGGPDRTFRLAVLRRSVGAGESQDGAEGSEEGTICSIIKLTAVVALDSTYVYMKMGTYKGMKVRESRVNIRFETNGISPHVMGEIINNDQIIFKAGYTRKRCGPEIAMYQGECSGSETSGGTKG
jgi:hypothetical protein